MIGSIQVGYEPDRLRAVRAREDAQFCTRGIWEAITTAGPAASFAHTDTDIDHSLDVLDNLLDEIT